MNVFSILFARMSAGGSTNSSNIFTNLGPGNKKRFLRSGARYLPSSFCIVAFSLISSNFGLAQQWEAVYGAPDRIEEGYDLTPIYQPCPVFQASYVTVGTTDPGSAGNKDVYVVKTGIGGNRIWEYTYDIGSLGGNDIAYAVKEDLSGDLIIVGSTDGSGTSHDMFLLRLDCDGTMNMGRIYTGTYAPINTGDDVAYDVILLPQTLGGLNDYGIAGYTTNIITGTREAVLMRIDYTGGIIWGNTYRVSNQNYDEMFLSLCSVANNTDLVGAGYLDDGTEHDGYIVRVSAANGTMVGANQGTGRYGTGNQFDDEIHSVIEMQKPSENGGVAMTGLTAGNRILLARVNNANFTFGLLGGVEYAITAPGSPDPFSIGYDIEEAGQFGPGPGVPTNILPYDLAITGRSTYANFGDQNAFLYTYRNPFNAGPPISIIARHYGGSALDEGRAVFVGSQVGAPAFGFAIGGSTQTDFQGVADPGDMYLIKTDLFGVDRCDNSHWESAQYVFLHSSVQSSIGSFGYHAERNTLEVEQNWDYRHCPVPTPKQTPMIEEFDITPNESGMDRDAFSLVSSNVIRGGEDLVLTVNIDREFEVVIYDAKGAVVASRGMSGGNETRFSTEGWGQGTYFIQIEHGEEVRKGQVILIE